MKNVFKPDKKKIEDMKLYELLAMNGKKNQAKSIKDKLTHSCP